MTDIRSVPFADSLTIDFGLQRAAEVAIEEVLAMKPGETALIVTNPNHDVLFISLALYDAALAAGAHPTLMVQRAKESLDMAEDTVIKALSAAPNAVISISALKMGKDRFALKENLVGKEGKKYQHIYDYLRDEAIVKSFWSPRVTAEMFARTVPINYTQLRRECAALKPILDRAVSVHVTTALGTDVTIGLAGRTAWADDGDFTAPGKGGNLPAGEVFISPALGESQGTIVFDGSMSLHTGESVVLDEPVVAQVEDGLVTTIGGGPQAALLEESLTAGAERARLWVRQGKLPAASEEGYVRNARHLGELGIGLNRAARIGGNMLEDEKVYSTCHIAIGSNYDHDAEALIHLDALIKSPTITAVFDDGRRQTFMADGELVL